jgi:histidine triad (HIT) family protein
LKNDCLFCGIIHDEMPAYKLYEDEHFLVILDRFPVRLGHSLIISKKHTRDLFGLPHEAARALMPLAQKMAKKMHGELKYEGLNLIQNNGEVSGQRVMHFHLHLIPRYDGDGMVIQAPPQDPSAEEFEAMAERLRQD